MNAAQIHLALNHAPLFLSVIGGGILVLGMIRKNKSFKTLSLYFLVAAAIFTAPVFLTGEGTEEIVENLAGVNKSAIENHEEMAKISLIIIIITGITAITGLIFQKNSGIAKVIFGIALVLSLVSFGSMAQTAHLGGLIRHSELQAGSLSETNENGNEANEQEEQSDKAIRSEEKAIKDSLKQIEKSLKKKNEDD